MSDGLTVLVAARDEEAWVGETVSRLRDEFPEGTIIVADDGSLDETAALARRAGATVLRLPRRGKGQALTVAERAAPPGALLLCDADVRGDLRPLLATGADVAVAAFVDRTPGGLGIAKRAARALIAARCGFTAREPLSGQRALTATARAAVFPLAPGFGCEARMTVDAVRAGLSVQEVELPLSHRSTGRDARGFAHRGRQLVHAVLACGPLATNFRGFRLPLVGAVVALGSLKAPARVGLGVAAIAAVGLVDDVASGPERGVREHLARGPTTGTLKLLAMPAVGLATTRSASAAAVVAAAAHAVNLLDTRPGRALKAFLLAAALLRQRPASYAAVAILLLPYDLREVVMLGDAGSNALGAVLGYGSVARITGRRRAALFGALAALSILGEYRSLGRLIERAPVLGALDRLGRLPA